MIISRSTQKFATERCRSGPDWHGTRGACASHPKTEDLGLKRTPHWTLFLFLWLLVAPLILYLVTALLFPTNQDDVVGICESEHTKR
jgi:hypothetical protein